MARLTEYPRGDLVLDVSDGGPVDGAPVVLLHGFPTDRTSWADVATRLGLHGMRTLAPDQRGYSPRARPPERDAYALPELVGDVVALLDAAGLDRAHVVGHDWGGGVAWAMAGSVPERVASLTVLSTPHPGALRRAMSTVDQARRSWYMAAFQVPWLPDRVVPAVLARTLRASGLPGRFADHYAERMHEPGAMTAALNWYRASAVGRGVLHRVRVPTTFVWGSADPFLGRHAAMSTREHVPGEYEFVEVDEGHWLPENAPELCAEAITRRVRSVASPA